MAEHIVEQFENVKLVEIDPNGACFLNVVATFLKISNYHNLSDIGKEGWVYLGLMCLKKMAKDGALVTKMVTFYQKEYFYLYSSILPIYYFYYLPFRF